MGLAKGEAVKFRNVATSTIVAVLVCGLLPNGTSAQSAPSALMSASSSGLTASVVSVAYDNGQVSAQIIIKNTSNFRIYIDDARFDDSQSGFLGSGENLGPPIVDGIPHCNDSYANCSRSSVLTTINDFSYIDPGKILGVDMQYSASQKPSNPDTISFSLTMMARFAKSNGDNSSDDVGPVREVTLAFPFLSFSQND
jgi:hypothetical protein